jgi:hypothetical protein
MAFGKKNNEPDPEDDEQIIYVELEPTKEEKEEHRYRLDRLITEGGFDHWHAERIAHIGGLDWREAVALKRKGCPQNLVYELLR